MLYSDDHYTYTYTRRNIFNTIRTSEDTSLDKYTSHFIWKGSKGLLKALLCERWFVGWTEQQHIDPQSYGQNSVSFPFSWLLNRGPGGPASMGHVPHSSIFSSTDWTSCAPSYIIIWHPLFFLRASQCRTQFNPTTVKVFFVFFFNIQRVEARAIP